MIVKNFLAEAKSTPPPGEFVNFAVSGSTGDDARGPRPVQGPRRRREVARAAAAHVPVVVSEHAEEDVSPDPASVLPLRDNRAGRPERRWQFGLALERDGFDPHGAHLQLGRVRDRVVAASGEEVHRHVVEAE